MSRARLAVYGSRCCVCDWVGSSCTVSVPVPVPMPVMTVAVGSGSAMTVPALTPAAVVSVRHRQVLSSLRCLDYRGVPVLWARCVGMPGRCPPQGSPVVVTPMTVLRVWRSGVGNSLMGTVGRMGGRKGVLIHRPVMICWLDVSMRKWTTMG